MNECLQYAEMVKSQILEECKDIIYEWIIGKSFAYASLLLALIKSNQFFAQIYFNLKTGKY